MENIIRDKIWFKEILKKPELQDITLRNLYEFYLTNNNIAKILPIITSSSNISIRVIDWFVTNYSKKFNIIYELFNIDINGDKYFNVFLQYKCQLKSYKKKLFDPFCRKERIGFYYNENKCVITTIGQLIFFKWALTYNVLLYVKNNLHIITHDMIISNKQIISKYIINKTLLNNINSDNINSDNIKSDTISSDNISSDNIKSDTIISDNISSDNISSDNKSKEIILEVATNSEKIRKKRHELSISANKTINIQNYSVVLSFD